MWMIKLNKPKRKQTMVGFTDAFKIIRLANTSRENACSSQIESSVIV